MRSKQERGAVLVLVAILMVVIIGVAALAIDIGHLVAVGNELQNAADAAALAGASVLFNADGSINTDANQVAYDTAVAHMSGIENIHVSNWSTNDGDIQRGHWTLPINGASAGFIANGNDTQADLFLTSNLNTDPNFINAVKVVVTRLNTPSFFGNVFPIRQRSAIAYVGFSSNFAPGDFDQPIAMCNTSITDTNGNVTCSTGRMISSNSNTGGFTNFDQSCSGAANPPTIAGLICTGNTQQVNEGSIAMNNGQLADVYRDVRSCWNGTSACSSRCGSNVIEDEDGNQSFYSVDQLDSMGNPGSDGIPDRPWNLTLPVISCTSGPVGNCEQVVGAVNLNVVWITESNPGQTTVPSIMDHPDGRRWTRQAGETDAQAWDSFAQFFGLVDSYSNSLPSSNRAIYVLPSCQTVSPRGATGGAPFGVPAERPVLVE
ncbi:MAG: hypothetical protein IH614_14255 [Desulfuromonadales bacterium]|nr:hypothetical protein [Desulfuromonadales bacterium]